MLIRLSTDAAHSRREVSTKLSRNPNTGDILSELSSFSNGRLAMSKTRKLRLPALGAILAGQSVVQIPEVRKNARDKKKCFFLQKLSTLRHLVVLKYFSPLYQHPKPTIDAKQKRASQAAHIYIAGSSYVTYNVPLTPADPCAAALFL